MKIIIRESQFNRILSEQVKPTLTLSSPSKLQSTTNVASGTINPTTGISDGDLHDFMAALAIGTAFIPYAGPFISAGIGLVDAGMYYNEGDKKSAGIMAALSMLPFIGRIPGVKELGAKGMAALASKINFGGKLTQTEINVVKSINSNPSLVKSELTTAANQVSPIIKQIELLKPKYIKQFGQQAYENQLGKLTRNEIGKDEFLKVLSSTKATTGVVQGVKGVVMTTDEIAKITNMAEKIAKGQKPSGVLKVKIGDELMDIPVEFVSSESQALGGYNPLYSKFRFNLNGLKNKSVEEIKRIIYHEVTHAKDPMPIFMKTNKKGIPYMTGDGSHYAYEAIDIGKKMEDIAKNTPKGQSLPKEYYELEKKADKLFSKYQFSPLEKTANFQTIYNTIPDKINSIIKQYPSKFGKKKAMDNLNLILNYFKRGGGGNIENIIGAEQVEYLNKLKAYDLKQYNDVVKKIFQEIENVKSQL